MPRIVSNSRHSQGWLQKPTLLPSSLTWLRQFLSLSIIAMSSGVGEGKNLQYPAIIIVSS